MSPENSSAPESRDALIGQIEDNCRFLVFRPDKRDHVLEMADIGMPEFESATYELEGHKFTIIADYPDSGHEDSISVEVTGEPERDEVGQWFVREEIYHISKQGDLTVDVQNRYEDLDSIVLHDHFLPIEEEYRKQRELRVSQGHGPLYEALKADNDRDKQVELGLSEVSDEELRTITPKIAQIASDPNSYEYKT